MASGSGSGLETQNGLDFRSTFVWNLAPRARNCKRECCRAAIRAQHCSTVGTKHFINVTLGQVLEFVHQKAGLSMPLWCLCPNGWWCSPCAGGSSCSLSLSPQGLHPVHLRAQQNWSDFHRGARHHLQGAALRTHFSSPPLELRRPAGEDLGLPEACAHVRPLSRCALMAPFHRSDTWPVGLQLH